MYNVIIVVISQIAGKLPRTLFIIITTKNQVYPPGLETRLAAHLAFGARCHEKVHLVTLRVDMQ